MGKIGLFALAALAALCVLPSHAQDPEARSRFFPLGTDGTLECTWNDVENPEDIQLVKWTFRGRRLREGKRISYSREGKTHRLHIKNVNKKDKGTYYCSPKIKTMELNDGTLVVSVDKARLPTPPEARPLQLTEGGQGKINCNYAEAKKRFGLKMFWTYNDKKFTSKNMVHEGSSAKYAAYEDEEGRDYLDLTNLDTNAAGTYKCNYKYPDKQVFSMQFIVSVAEQVGPADVVKNVTVNEDQYSNTLSCDLSGLSESGISSFRWEKDGEVVSNNTDPGRIKLSENGNVKRLEIDDLDADAHSGVYRCIAELPYFPVALRFNLVVEESRKDRDFAAWSVWSACDKAGRKYRFRTCTDDGCSDRYGFVYEVETSECDDDMDMA